jgi:hypothetical protein
MEPWDVLVRSGDVRDPDEEVIEASIDNLLTKVRYEQRVHSLSAPQPHHLARIGGASVALLLAVCIAIASLLVIDQPSTHHSTGSAHNAGRARVLSPQAMRLISTSTAAVENSGTAVESTVTSGGVALSPPTTIDVTFSGHNVNYLIASNGNGAQGVQNRIVDGQLYLYIKGRDLKMHWYHETNPNAAASLSFPDPRTLIATVGPSLRFEDVGQQELDGVPTTHLQATTPGALRGHGIPHGLNGTITAFDAWVDSDNVVRQIVVTAQYQTCSIGQLPNAPIAPNTVPSSQSPARISASPALKQLTPGAHGCTTTTSTVQIRFANLGVPESITVPPGAINQESLG